MKRYSAVVPWIHPSVICYGDFTFVHLWSITLMPCILNDIDCKWLWIKSVCETTGIVVIVNNSQVRKSERVEMRKMRSGWCT